MIRRFSLATLVATSSCVLDFPDESAGPFACESNSDCAKAYECQSKRCVAAGTVAPLDASAGVDAIDDRSDAAMLDGAEPDSSVSDDMGVPVDLGVPVDSGAPHDAGVRPDAQPDATTWDTGVAGETGVAADTGVAAETGVAADTGGPVDAGVAIDTGAVTDTGVHDDAAAADAQPMDAQPMDAQPMDAQPMDAQPMDAQPTDADPLDSGMHPDAQPPVDAGCALTWCDGACIDPSTSADHCGACGHSCGAGACFFSACQPFLTNSQTNHRPGTLIVDDSAASPVLYWADSRSSGSIQSKVIADGTPVNTFADTQNNVPAIQIDGTNVYWSTIEQTSGSRPGRVRYRDKAMTAGVVEITATDQANPRGLAVAQNVVYWNSNSPLHIRAQSVPPGFNTDYVPTMGSSFVNALLADASNVYWFDAQANIFAHPRTLPTSGTPVALSTFGGEAKAVAQTATHIYWGEAANALQGQGRIFRVDKASAVIDTLATQAHLTDPDQGATALALDATHIYYATERSNGTRGAVFRIPLAGGTPELVADGFNTSSKLAGIAVHGDFVYWGETDSTVGHIRAIRKPR